MGDETWYSARCVFRHRASASSSYEERVILLHANSFDEALRQAEAEARAYAASLEGVEYLEYLDLYRLFENSVGDGTEVFSLIRDSEMEPAEYISRFFDTGSEHSRSVDPKDAV